jgi:hypothetical protein
MDMKETKGLLISTHSMKAYPLKEGSSPIQSNKESIVIGNGEVRMSKCVTENMTLQTNIGQNSAFEVGTDTNFDIFGCKDGELTEICGFEVYQVELKHCEMKAEEPSISEKEQQPKSGPNRNSSKALEKL